MFPTILIFILTFRVSELVDIGFAILSWAISNSFMFCLLIFALVMVKTLIDIVKKYSPPRGRKEKQHNG
jgi:hypothetical protein